MRQVDRLINKGAGRGGGSSIRFFDSPVDDRQTHTHGLLLSGLPLLGWAFPIWLSLAFGSAAQPCAAVWKWLPRSMERVFISCVVRFLVINVIWRPTREDLLDLL